jgi:NAD(P)-dependent dehydrogenase (short-subunit alcohol dehydrogenase family)
MRRFDGKIAMVTGAARGIGRAIAARFVDEGAHVVLVDLDRAAGERTCAELALRGRVRFDELDVADEVAVTAVIDAAVTWGGGLDIVVNNAGIANPARRPLGELTLEEWWRVLDSNLTGPMLVARAAEPHLRRRRGAIVNISSTRAVMSEPNTFAYSASKGGLDALTHALAISLGPDIRVNAIAPGWIATEGYDDLRDFDHLQHPAGRVGNPEDIAAAVAYLASAEAGFVTGTVLTVDGGMTHKMIYVE